MGGVIFFGSYGVFVYFFIKEAPVFWKEGPGSFFFELIMRLVFGMLFVTIALLPYYVGSAAAKQSRLSALFFAVSLVVFIPDIWLRIHALFFPNSSTAAVGLIFSPFYLAVPVALVWGFVHLRNLSRKRHKG